MVPTGEGVGTLKSEVSLLTPRGVSSREGSGRSVCDVRPRTDTRGFCRTREGLGPDVVSGTEIIGDIEGDVNDGVVGTRGVQSRKSLERSAVHEVPPTHPSSYNSDWIRTPARRYRGLGRVFPDEPADGSYLARHKSSADYRERDSRSNVHGGPTPVNQGSRWFRVLCPPTPDSVL